MTAFTRTDNDPIFPSVGSAEVLFLTVTRPFSADLVGLVDSVVFLLSPVITENPGLVDNFAIARTLVIGEDTGLTDNLVFFINPVFTDLAVVNDTAANTFSPGDLFNITDSDGFEVVSLLVDYPLALSDLVSLLTNPTFTDLLGMQDSFTLLVNKRFDDGLILDDSSFSFSFVKVINETLDATDAGNVYTKNPGSRVVTDDTGLTDNVIFDFINFNAIHTTWTPVPEPVTTWKERTINYV